MISTALLAISLAASSFGGALLTGDQSRRDYWQAPDYPYWTGEMPVQIVPAYAIPTDADVMLADLTPMHMATLDSYDFEWGYEYFPYSAVVVCNTAGAYTFHDMIWYKVYKQGVTNYGNSCLPNGYWSFVMANYEDATCHWFGPQLNMDWDDGDNTDMTYQYDAGGKLEYWYTVPDPLSTHYIEQESANQDVLCQIVGKAFLDQYDRYSSGYADGFADGSDAGYQQGKIDGAYEESQGINASGSLFTNLFGALVNVPISILNGLSPMAIWNVPIISLILTFVAAGAVLFLIKKVI